MDLVTYHQQTIEQKQDVDVTVRNSMPPIHGFTAKNKTLLLFQTEQEFQLQPEEGDSATVSGLQLLYLRLVGEAAEKKGQLLPASAQCEPNVSARPHLRICFFYFFLIPFALFLLYICFVLFFPLTCPFANLGCHLNQCSGMVTPAVGHIRFPAGKATCDRGNKSQTQMQSIAQSPVCGHFSHGTFHLVPADVGFI